MFDVLSVGSPMALGMAEEAFENDIDSLVASSRKSPVSRADVYALLERYHVSLGELSTWLRGKIGDIEVYD